MTRTSIVILALSSWFALPGHAQEKVDDVTLQVVKYDAVKDEILKNRGKVVLLDLWGDFCLPCKKKAFPHTVALSRKHQKDGLVVITVSIDSKTEKDKDLNFLKKQQATFTNFLLDEPEGFWQAKFRSSTVPCIYVFDRQGKWTQFQSFDGLDGLIEELLAEKS